MEAEESSVVSSPMDGVDDASVGDTPMMDVDEQADAGDGASSSSSAAVAKEPISKEELDMCASVLTKLSKDMDLYNSKDGRSVRKALVPFFDAMKSRFYQGLTPADYSEKKRNEKDIRGRRARDKALDRNLVNKVALRKERIEKLEKLLQQKDNLLMIPDGPACASVDVSGQTLSIEGAAPAGEATTLEEGSASATAADSEKPQMEATGDGEEEGRQEVTASGERPTLLNFPRACYVCKTRFRQLHHFYDLLCPECAALNWEKRNQQADLTTRVALVTGGRVKIGYWVVLKLLRAGAHVIVTTRFPNDAVERLAKEPDYDTWRERVDVFGIDFRDIASIESFCAYVRAKYARLDVLINNACQTVRRPVMYYTPLIKKELVPLHALPAAQQAPLQRQKEFLVQCASSPAAPSITSGEAAVPLASVAATAATSTSTSSTSASAAAAADSPPPAKAARYSADGASAMEEDEEGIEHIDVSAGQQQKKSTVATRTSELAPHVQGMLSAIKSQVPLLVEDTDAPLAAFPDGVVDVNGQQLDLRERNTWIMRLEEVETPEVAEVLAINTIAPFVLNSRLVPLMERTGGRKFIVNVSAMEGKFYRAKSPYHPHTNMAKAALNMMTRTSADDLCKKDIYMNSVDTGWINDENPLEKAQRYAEKHNFQTPIDEIDAAARILDPVFSGIAKAATPEFGKFLKDYHVTEW